MSKREAANSVDFVGAFYGALKQQYRLLLLGWINAERAALGRPALDYPAVGATQHEVVWKKGSARLLRYGGPGERRAPLLVVPSLINRAYILDLLPGRSVIERLRQAGIDVWLLDWGEAEAEDAERGLDDYTLRVLPQAAAAIGTEPHVLGYCMGGTMAAAAIARGKLPARSLVALAAPIDCHDGGTLSVWAQTPSFDAAEIAGAFGNVPPYVLQPAFKMLDPVGLLTKFLHARDRVEDDAFCTFFLAMETWLEDNVPFPGAAFTDWMEKVYRQNGLVSGTWRLGGAKVDLGKLRCPILNIVAEGDYICPPKSSAALLELAGSRDKETITMPGGHIGLSTGGAAHKKLWPRVAEWLLERTVEHKPMVRAARRVRRRRTVRR